jgi:hypothetical protein
MIKEQVIESFKKEFAAVAERFEIMDLLENGSTMDDPTIRNLKLPSVDDNIVWYPGVYVFIGDNSVYRVGVSLDNSRARVLQHLKAETASGGYCIWDIDKYEDKSILLFNVKERKYRHWLLALELFLELEFTPKIESKRKGSN